MKAIQVSLKKNKILQAVAVVLSLAPALAQADWSQSLVIGVVQPAPSQPDGTGPIRPQVQNPPSFQWYKSWTADLQGYVVEIAPEGSNTTLFTYLSDGKRNFVLPAAPLPDGAYQWRVGQRLTSSAGAPVGWSVWRHFVIDQTSKKFIVPEVAALEQTVRAHPRPRQLPANFLLAGAWPQSMKDDRLDDRSEALTSLKRTAGYGMALVAVNNANATAKNAGEVRIQLEAAAFLFHLTRDPIYLNEARARGNQLSALDINGVTSFTKDDQLARSIALALAKAADFLWNDLDTATRTTWLTTAVNRSEPMYQNLIKDNIRLDLTPFDSHGVETLGYLALISTLALDEVPKAKDHFDYALRSYAHLLHVWSGPEGGYANGSAYAQFTADAQMQVWPALAEASGVNLFEKPWSIGLSNFFTQFLPPGTTSRVFGDAHENSPVMEVLKGYASRIKTPQAAWYRQQTQEFKESPITLLQAPYPLPATSQVAAPPDNAALFKSIGWVAMHSDITDPNRTSVYFKSSPYGSYNHSHGDQNSLVINSGKAPLLIEAGAQDFYGSEQAYTWYRTTKAHNAITYIQDGITGIGQIVDKNLELMGNNGKVTAFSSTPSLDYAEGDAPPAYNEPAVGTVPAKIALTTANRKVWYLREQDVVVVLDTLATPVAKRFEWNMHAKNQIDLTGVKATIQNGGHSLCLELRDPDGTTLEARTAPSGTGAVQGHAAFVKSTAALNTEFLVVLDVGCKNLLVRVDRTTAGRQLTVGGKTIDLPPKSIDLLPVQ